LNPTRRARSQRDVEQQFLSIVENAAVAIALIGRNSMNLQVASLHILHPPSKVAQLSVT
jgi:hypothetical protein